MPDLNKLLTKFSEEEIKTIEFLIEKIVSLSWKNLNIKKLKGHQNIFRIRKGKIRIIFIKRENNIPILAIERHREGTYKI